MKLRIHEGQEEHLKRVLLATVIIGTVLIIGSGVIAEHNRRRETQPEEQSQQQQQLCQVHLPLKVPKKSIVVSKILTKKMLLLMEQT